jgi:hypothetical protein
VWESLWRLEHLRQVSGDVRPQKQGPQNGDYKAYVPHQHDP